MLLDKGLSYTKGDFSGSLSELTIGSLLEKQATLFPDREALVSAHQGQRISYQELNAQADQLASGLLKIGVKQGDRVGIWSQNCIEWTITQYATAKIGAILVCINPAYKSLELEYALKKVSCSTLIMTRAFKSSNYIDILKQLIPHIGEQDNVHIESSKLPSLKSLVLIDEQKEKGFHSFNDLFLQDKSLIENVRAICHSLRSDQPINIQFTSGTTGSPKGATLTHFNITNNAFSIAEKLRMDETDKLCIPVPLYHCFGMVGGNLTCLVSGACAVLCGESFDPLATLKTVDAERCTILHGVPTMFIAQLRHSELDTFNLTTLRTGAIAGATCPEELIIAVQEKMHMDALLIAYGQTETSPLSCMLGFEDPIEKRLSTVGKVLRHTEVKVIDLSGNTVERNTIGELCTRGYCVMPGYWNDEEKTLTTIDSEGWLHSGDLAIMDDDGYLSIVGRSKDLIIRGGENIFPRDIEDILHGLDAIEDVAIFGVTDDYYGERVCAWVKVAQGYEISEQDIKNYLSERIAHFKVPSLIRFVDEFPLTVTGKLQKYKMRESMESEQKNRS
ncbi:AMP-binding protein [Vibrio sagamiensis]|uniref:AMP-binding protein n=1 Tax=Vibrio sagamiensis NBRC 104589 TaxID=1219064 RepID=A0A511QEN2_9VIBR|nr:AMP-binding protein [Vibrio sagamiensis]PNQ54521.1 AMP-binding protein [Vibrio agarivorans]GEM75761.1 AMP-binding protein [Vibrio sagamiensis NBRC 104589]